MGTPASRLAPEKDDAMSYEHLLILAAALPLFSCESLNSTPSAANGVFQERVNAGITGDQCRDQCGDNGSQPTMCSCRSASDCVSRGDCCADRYFGELKTPRLQCVPAYERALVAVSTCPDAWTDDETRLLCEGVRRHNVTYLRDLPVLGVATRILYRNIFCAICNGDTRKLSPWTLNVTCVPGEIAQVFSNSVAQREAVVIYSVASRSLTVHWRERSGRCILRINELIPDNYAETWGVTPCELREIVTTCPDDFEDAIVLSKCYSYTSLLLYKKRQVIYRNYHCALCNGQGAEDLSCVLLPSPGPSLGLHGAGVSYTIVMNFSNWWEVEARTVSSATVSSGYSGNYCTQDEVYDPLLRQCLASSCPADVCPHPGCEWTRIVRDNVDVREDDSLIVMAKKGMALPSSLWRVDEYSNDHILACLPIRTDDVALGLIDVKGVLTTTVLLTSVTCLFMHVAAYVLVPKLRNGPSRLQFCLAVSLLVAQSSFLAGGLLSIPGSRICAGMAIVSHGAHLAAFFWMNVMAVDIESTFR